MVKILIVDDNESFRKNLISLIDGCGDFIVIEAENVQEGVDKIRQTKPDIVMSEIMMSSHNGLEIFEKTQNHNYGAIVMTNEQSFKDVVKAMRIGISDYLIKPIDQKQLYDALQRAFLHHQQLLSYEETLRKKEKLEKHFQTPLFQTKDLLVEKMLAYIHENYMHKIILNDLTQELHYSQTLLNKRFKKVTSMTFCDYLNRYRITKAIEMMKEGQRYIYDIAAGCGFHEYKYFSVVFKKYTHCSLKEFMRQIEI